MKPIYLEIEGLNSFKDKQVVDFSKLVKNGIFGIFGPTGSGKSTVLDAIILSLYGRIDRAVKLIDFINVNRNSTTVMLKFDARENNEISLYEIQRVFKIKKGTTVVESEAYLYKLDGEEKILIADKVKDATSEINKILGMNYNDFKRCIALPQGEFATFISEPHSEKINIIARIFSLDKYGSKLNSKVSDLALNYDKEYFEVKAKLEAFGNVSKNSIEEKKQQFSEKLAELKILKAKIAGAESEIIQCEEMCKKVEELANYESEFEKLTNQSNQIDECKEKIDKANKAKQIMPKMREMVEVEHDVNMQKRNLEKLTIEFEAKNQSLQTELDNFEEVKKEFYENILKFTQKIEKLELLRDDVKYYEELNLKQNLIKEEFESIERKVNQIMHEKEDLTELQGKSENYIEQLTVEAGENSLNEQTLEQVCETREKEGEKRILETIKEEVENKLEEVIKQKTELGFKIDQTLKGIDAEEKEISAIDETILDNFGMKGTRNDTLAWFLQDNAACSKGVEAVRIINKNINARTATNNGYRELMNRLKMDIDIISNDLEESKIAVEKRDDEFAKAILERDDNIKSVAVAKMTKNLKVNDSCPICKTTIIKPIPSLISVVSDEAIDSKLNIAKSKLTFATKQRLEIAEKLREAKTRYSLLDDSINENEREIAYLIKERSQLLSTIAQINSDKDAQLADLMQFSDDRLAELQNLVKKANKLELNILESRQDLIQVTSKRDALKNLEKAYKAEIEEIEQQISDINVSMSGVSYKTYGATSLSEFVFGLDNKRSAILAKLTEQKELKKSCLNHIKEYEEEIATARIKLNSLKEQSTAIDMEKNAIIKKLQADVPEGSSIDNEIAKYRDAVSSVKQLENESNNKIKMLQSENALANQAIADSKAMLKSSQKIFETVKKDCLTLLSNSGFKNIDELKVAYLNDEAIEKLVDVTAKSQSRINVLEQQISTLKEQTDGFTLSYGELREAKFEFEESVKRKENLEKQVAVLENEFNVMNEKIVQTSSLVSDKKVIDDKRRVLDELKQSLSGNALMEYMALGCLQNITVSASQTLLKLTSGRYHLEYDTDFVVVDNINDGVKRGVLSLSGGEIFMVSLSLAMAINEGITNMSSRSMEFFFLDEGFGTLDKELVDSVINSLERFKENSIKIGLISHVPELQDKVESKLVLTPATEYEGSRIKLIC